MRRRQTKPEVIDMSVRSWERGRQRERNYYDEEDIVFRRRPEFLRNDYYRGDRAPLVRHAREVDRSSRPTNSALAPGISRRQSSLDTFDRRPRSTSPEIRIRQRSVEGSPSPSERMRTRYAERERPGREVDIAFRRGRTSSETRDGRRSPPPASRPSVYYDTSRLAAVEYKTTRYREVDEVIWDLSRTKDVTLHRKPFSHTNSLLLPMRFKSVVTVSGLSCFPCSCVLGAKTTAKLSAHSEISRSYSANLLDS